MTARPIEPHEAAQAADTLADAFAEDPAMRWAGRWDDGSRRLRHLWRAVIARRLRHDEPLVWCTPDLGSVAVWDGPGEADWSTIDGIRAFPSLLRTFGVGTFRFLQVESVTTAAHPVEPHYYLLAVGVHRSAQGSGLGSAVLQPMLDRCDAEGLPAYLESSNPRNEPFYGRLGFGALAPLELPQGAPPLMPMWRDAP